MPLKSTFVEEESGDWNSYKSRLAAAYGGVNVVLEGLRVVCSGCLVISKRKRHSSTSSVAVQHLGLISSVLPTLAYTIYTTIALTHGRQDVSSPSDAGMVSLRCSRSCANDGGPF